MSFVGLMSRDTLMPAGWAAGLSGVGSSVLPRDGASLLAVPADEKAYRLSFSARAGTPRVVVGKILGHADADVTGRHDAHAYDRDKRDALAKWAADLLRIAAGKKQAKQSKVLPWASSARM